MTDSDATQASLPCVLDIEASGFGRGSYPIEIGFVLPDGTAYCTLIAPDAGWTHWDGDAERVHGISRSLLQRHGKSAAEVAAELNQRLAGRAVYCDNWAHDYTWLARLFESAATRPSFQLRHVRELLSENAAERFDDMREIVARNLQLRRHRASLLARAATEPGEGLAERQGVDDPMRRGRRDVAVDFAFAGAGAQARRRP